MEFLQPPSGLDEAILISTLTNVASTLDQPITFRPLPFAGNPSCFGDCPRDSPYLGADDLAGPLDDDSHAGCRQIVGLVETHPSVFVVFGAAELRCDAHFD